MRKIALLFVMPSLRAAPSLFAETSTAQVNSAHSSSGTSSVAASAAPTTLPISTVPWTTPSGSSSSPTATGDILMIKLYVGNIPRAEKFYGALFGAKLAVKIGKGAADRDVPQGAGPGPAPKDACRQEQGGRLHHSGSELERNACRYWRSPNGAKSAGDRGHSGQPSCAIHRSSRPVGKQRRDLAVGIRRLQEGSHAAFVAQLDVASGLILKALASLQLLSGGSRRGPEPSAYVAIELRIHEHLCSRGLLDALGEHAGTRGSRAREISLE